MKTPLTILLLLTALLPLRAQDEPFYRMEIGVGAGMMGYLGDFNGNLTKNLQPMAAATARYNFDVYRSLRLNVQAGKVKGSSADVETYYPDYAATPYEFDNTLVSADLTFEYNFWPYGTGRDYYGAKRLTPYLFGGLGMTYAKLSEETSGKSSAFTANVPIGVGIKYKVGKRVNLGLEWAMHFSLSDELDGSKDPYGIKSTGAFKNTDCYHTLQLSLTYSFMAKCRTCHNEDE